MKNGAASSKEKLPRNCSVMSCRGRLEGDIVVGDAGIGIVGLAGRGALVEAGSVGLGVAAGTGAFTSPRASAKECEFIDEDLGLVAFLARFLVVPGSVGDLTFHQNLRSFFDVITND